MTLRETTSPTGIDPAQQHSRALGSFESLFDLYTRENPVRFSVVVELDTVVPAEVVQIALDALQASQPLLSARIDRSEHPARFVPTDRRLPLLIAPSGTPWEVVAATEQAVPLDQLEDPAARCTLVWSGASTFLVLTLSHQIADGLSAASALRDLVRALNGERLGVHAFPESQEDLVAAAVARTTPVDSGAKAASEDDSRIVAPDDARMARRGTVRPFDAAVPDVESLVWSPDLTRAARREARAQRTTLHGLVTAAIIRVLFRTTDRDFLSLMNPMDLRRPTGADDQVALRFLSARMGFAPEGSTEIWPLARAIRDRIASAQTLPNLAAMSEGMGYALPADPSVADAVEAMVSFANYDLMVTNLGDLGGPDDESVVHPARVRLVDLFGPTMTTQIEGEYVVGVSTFGGSLRTTVTTRHPIPHFVELVRDEVAAAVE